MVSFSLRQRIFLPPPTGPSPVSFHLSQFGRKLARSLKLPTIRNPDGHFGLGQVAFQPESSRRCNRFFKPFRMSISAFMVHSLRITLDKNAACY